MIEYIFVNEKFRQLFGDFLNARKINFTTGVDPIEDTPILSIEEPEDDELWDLIEEKYDELSVADQAETEKASTGVSGAGIYIELANGVRTLATVNPDTMNRILAAISMDEFNDLVEVIVRSVEKPDDSPICQQLGKDQNPD